MIIIYGSETEHDKHTNLVWHLLKLHVEYLEWDQVLSYCALCENEDLITKYIHDKIMNHV